jgi:hypothetical protein
MRLMTNRPQRDAWVIPLSDLLRPGPSRLSALTEQLETLFCADSLTAGLIAGAVPENLRLPYRSRTDLMGSVITATVRPQLNFEPARGR